MSTIRNSPFLVAAFLLATIILPANPREGFAEKDSDKAGQTRGELHLQNEPWEGDLEGMLQRRMIRTLVVYSKTQYYVD